MLVLYLLMAMVVWWHVWVTGSPRSTISCGCGDPVQELWWLEWVPWAIAHGHNPFFTSALFSGTGGVNALTNTSALFPGLVLAPVTALWGPIASFNVIATVAPVISAYAMFLFGRALSRTGAAGAGAAGAGAAGPSVTGPVLAGLLYGFSPFVMANLPLGHVHLVLGPFLPLLALIVYKIVTGTQGGVAGRRRAALLGLLAGLLLVAQYFTGSELMAITAVAAVGGLLPVLIWRRRTWWARRGDLLVAAGAALVVALPLLAYPIHYEVAGRRHTIGPPWPDNTVGQAAGTIVNPVHHLSTALLPLHLLRYFGALKGPPLGYVGWALIVFLLLSVVVWFRRPVAWGALVMGLLAWQLSVGIPRHGDQWTLWRVLAHVPVVADIQPYRFSDIVFFCAAILLTISVAAWRSTLDRFLTRDLPHQHQHQHQHQHRLQLRFRSRLVGLAAVIPLIAAVGVLVPVATTYAIPLAASAKNEPAWFRLQAPKLPLGTRVLTIPFPTSIVPDAMAWQAEDDLRFDLVGGYALTPGQDGRHDSWVDPLTGAAHLLSNLTYGVPRPVGTPAQMRALYGAFKAWGVQVMVLPERFVNAAADAALLTAADGRLPLIVDGAYVWVGHGPFPFTHIDPLELLKCGSLGNGIAGPKCVALSELAARVVASDQRGAAGD
ncbi:MAG TPA: hypothetical protein VHV57_04285 [Acidimicrobiales bacterium]|nr:hypothetical protein [Acidimicrobiales bacterium]